MIVGVFVLSAALYWGASYTQTYLVGWVGQRALQDLREQIYTHLQGMSIGFFTRNKPGVLISRLTNDVEALDSLVTDGVVTLISSTLTLLGVVVILLLLDPALALIIFVTFPLLAIGSVVFRIASTGAYRLTREKIANITAYLQETLSGVRVVRSFAQEPRHLGRMSVLNEENRAANMTTVYLNAAYFPAVELLSAIGTAVILLYGGYRAIDGDIEIGILVAFVGYLNAFFDPIQQISQLYTTYQQGMAALDKIFDLLETQPDMVDRAGRARPGADPRARSSWTTSRSPTAATDWALRRGRPPHPGRADGGAGRRDGGGQVDVREAGGALLRPAARAGAGRRPRPAGAELEGAPQPARDRPPGGLPVLGHGARQHRLRPAGRRARRRSGRRRPAVGADAFIERLPDGIRDRGRRARRPASRRDSASWWRSRGRCSPSRGS